MSDMQGVCKLPAPPVHVPSEQPGSRKFYEYPSEGRETSSSRASERSEDEQIAFVERLAEDVVGSLAPFAGPFGERLVVYCDHTASGRAVGHIERYIQNKVLPFYGNTHTTTSVTGRRSTFFRHEARDLVKRACNGNEDDVLIFTGSGCTAAVHKLIHTMGLPSMPEAERKQRLKVFTGPFEHHSNLLPWRELGATVITIREGSDGLTDLEELEKALVTAADTSSADSNAPMPILIGSFSAASNVTGVLERQDEISVLLHRHGALAFWDFAAAAAYTPIDMNSLGIGLQAKDPELAYKDAVFLSPHKLLGGVGTPGVLLAKRSLFSSAAPEVCGGGTVFFVGRQDHRYLSAIEEREEGGTPDIVGSIRCGLAFQLKERVGTEYIHQRELQLAQRFMARFGGDKVAGLRILGPVQCARLPVFSFVIEHGASNRLLHHDFVCAILNDLFGIQTRGGCACAGPYSQELLGMDEQLAKQIEMLLLAGSSNDESLNDVLPRERDRLGAGNELFRPGFCRLNLHYTMDDATADFVMDALEWVATDGWRLLPMYKCNEDTGEWVQDLWSHGREREWLDDISFGEGSEGDEVGGLAKKGKEELAEYFKACLAQARELAKNARKSSRGQPHKRVVVPHDPEVERKRWFLYPAEARLFLLGEEHPAAMLEMPLFPVKVYASAETDTEESGAGEEKTAADGKEEAEEERAKFKFHAPPKNLWKKALAGLVEFDMIRDGDRVLACLSGGKDSLSMLHILRQYQRFARSKGVRFELGAATVDPQIPLQFDPRPLIGYCAELGIPYFYESQGIMRMAKGIDGASDSICSFCSRIKRGVLYSCARREHYNVLAMGQHLDDLAESFFMSVLHNGLLRTMKAHYLNNEKDLRIIRPLAYVRERDLAAFAQKKKLPVIPENCPACFEEPKERHRVKQLLASQERLFPAVFNSIVSAIHPLMAISGTGQEANSQSRWVRQTSEDKGKLIVLADEFLPPKDLARRPAACPPIE